MTPEFQKSQTIRLLDVFLLGPYLIYIATRPKMTKEEATILTALGIATIIYNWRNYQLNKAYAD